MAKSDNFPEKQKWGTWEELLLACAVHRYGSDSWDSVAMELQKRTSTLQHFFFTPLSCQQKFQDLKRRFAKNDVEGDDAKTTINNTAAVPWLDELRKLRVAELRREVQQYDLSIVSLQLKVQKMKEAREQSLRENEKEIEKSDLEGEKESVQRGEDNEPEDQTKKPVHGGKESDRENRSVNESNSTDPKDESPGTGPEKAKAKVKPESVESEGCETGKEVENVKPAGKDSCNGSCDSVAKESAGNLERVDPRREPGDSPESVAESKGEEPNRESSDVQSSASLSGKEKKIAEPNKPDEPENEELDQSPTIKKVSIESQPLVEFLKIFRSHKLGSLFERRLESQETPDYLNLILQHLDFETIRMRLEEDWYSGCKSKFFRDLLLLLNNAIVFFDEKSPEHTAAIEFRQLVSKEIAAQIPNSSMLPKERSSKLPESQMPLKLESEPSLSLSTKPKLSVPLIACRKCSSITAKSSTSSSGQEKKRQPIATLMNGKPDWKQHDNSSEKAEESLVTKKRTRERSASGTRKANKNVNTRNHTNANRNSDSNTNAAISSKGGSSNENAESKGEKKTNSNVSSMKRSLANFLNRMRSSSSNNGPLIETLKGVISSDNGIGDGVEQKKNSSCKGDQRKDQISTPRIRSGGKRAKERGSPAKRSTGRPPKRAAAPSRATPSVPAKRVREVVENDSGTGHAKKRSRK